MGVNKIAEEVGVSKMTLYKYLRHRKVEISSYNKTIKLVLKVKFSPKCYENLYLKSLKKGNQDKR